MDHNVIDPEERDDATKVSDSTPADPDPRKQPQEVATPKGEEVDDAEPEDLDDESTEEEEDEESGDDAEPEPATHE